MYAITTKKSTINYSNKEVIIMVLKDSLDNIIEPINEPKISVPVILQEAERVTNAAIKNIQSDCDKIWVPK